MRNLIKTISDSRGSLTVIEGLPFEIRRVYYLHNIDHTAQRGGHAHRALRRVMVAVHGSFTVRINKEREVILDDPRNGLLIEPMEWLDLHSFTPDAVCLALASLEHDEADCIRDYDEFLRLAA